MLVLVSLIVSLCTLPAQAQTSERDIEIRRKIAEVFIATNESIERCEAIKIEQGTLDLDVSKLREMEMETGVISSIIAFYGVSNMERCIEPSSKKLEAELWKYHDFLLINGPVHILPSDPTFALPMSGYEDSQNLITPKIMREIIESMFTHHQTLIKSLNEKSKRLESEQSAVDIQRLKNMVGEQPFDAFATMDAVQASLGMK